MFPIPIFFGLVKPYIMYCSEVYLLTYVRSLLPLLKKVDKFEVIQAESFVIYYVNM